MNQPFLKRIGLSIEHSGSMLYFSLNCKHLKTTEVQNMVATGRDGHKMGRSWFVVSPETSRTFRFASNDASQSRNRFHLPWLSPVSSPLELTSDLCHLARSSEGMTKPNYLGPNRLEFIRIQEP